jgi:predicted TIM-barrel fold metal-dependent hydrolase
MFAVTRSCEMAVQGGGLVTSDMEAADIDGIELNYKRDRQLGYPVFDVDHHLYETTDALIKFLPPEYEGIVKYVEVNGRSKLAFDDKISGWIPNPTFVKVAPPGGSENDPHQRRAIPSPDAFFHPDARLKLMRELGIEKAVMFPTLACLVEHRFGDDVGAIHAIVHAYNQWLYEHWGFVYEDSIYSAPVVSCGIVSEGIKELEWLLERGAKTFQFRIVPVGGYNGPRSFALKEFDPFWKLVEEADILVSSHSVATDMSFINSWEGRMGREFRPYDAETSPAFLRLSSERSVPADGVASIIGHGLATRFPKIRFSLVEYGTEWVPPLVERMQRHYEEMPFIFDEDPLEVFRRNIFVHSFRNKEPKKLVDLVGTVDNFTFGSDFPHMEGLNDPASYTEFLEGWTQEDKAKIMGGNLARIMKVDAHAHPAAK